MFITLETSDGAEAIINTVYVTHVTQVESRYPEAGSCVHFTSDRAIQVTLALAQIRGLLETAAPPPRPPAGEPFMLSKV